MTASQKQMFGGDWTEQKLAMLQRYLAAYTTALKKQPFELVYIDAFAGTGYREAPVEQADDILLFADLAGPEPQGLLDGSARIALRTDPPFHRYVFIESSTKRADELRKLAESAGDLRDRIEVVQTDCNEYLQRACRVWNRRQRRAVLFLDPYGMQVDWQTMVAVAATRAIDVWVLFPLGVAVNRLLKRNGTSIPDDWRKRLDRIFGTSDWYDRFYREVETVGLFATSRETRKVCTPESISRYYNERLRSVFAEVADAPRRLTNSRGNPLFLLCFAAANPKGAPIAIRIAQHILRETL